MCPDYYRLVNSIEIWKRKMIIARELRGIETSAELNKKILKYNTRQGVGGVKWIAFCYFALRVEKINPQNPSQAVKQQTVIAIIKQSQWICYEITVRTEIFRGNTFTSCGINGKIIEIIRSKYFEITLVGLVGLVGLK